MALFNFVTGFLTGKYAICLVKRDFTIEKQSPLLGFHYWMAENPSIS